MQNIIQLLQLSNCKVNWWRHSFQDVSNMIWFQHSGDTKHHPQEIRFVHAIIHHSFDWGNLPVERETAASHSHQYCIESKLAKLCLLRKQQQLCWSYDSLLCPASNSTLLSFPIEHDGNQYAEPKTRRYWQHVCLPCKLQASFWHTGVEERGIVLNCLAMILAWSFDNLVQTASWESWWQFSTELSYQKYR